MTFILTFKIFQLSSGSEAIAIYNSQCVPRVGECIRLPDGIYRVDSITYDYTTMKPYEISVIVDVSFITWRN